MAETARGALDTLRQYEKRSLIHAVGLPAQSTARGSWTGIAFGLEGANLVGQLDEIVEIMPLPRLTSVPGAKSWVLGMANVRGTLVPVADLRGYLSGEKSPIGKSSRVLVTVQQDSSVGLLVDVVWGQRQFDREERCEPGHFLEHMAATCINQEFEKDDEFWGQFNLQKLVNSADFLQAAV